MTGLVRFELLKLARQPALLFWGFFFVPLAVTVFKLFLILFIFIRSLQSPATGSDLILAAAKSLSISGNSLAQLLFAIGIAGVFHLEYRLATWRLVVPRASRVSIWLAKFLTCLFCIFISLSVLVLGDFSVDIVAAFTSPGSSSLEIHPDSVQMLIISSAIATMELTVLIALVSAMAILTRSLIAAVLPAFMLAIVSSIMQVYLGTTTSPVPLPAFGAEMLRTWLFDQSRDVTDAHAWSGLAILTLWLLVGIAIGSIGFARQQLYSE
ncbi:hypothetical protein [Rhizobium binxianense]|uniref:hypothetical protein n=1 Tax=Rhizobium binxianense TaxID=3024242 RepID=UPI00234EA581|nr:MULTISPECIES: hypothetical protein [unclassified Rhizobium]MDC7744808.1 hypothetical protein [Rhizobium sp. BC56]MDC9811595.1 hypothetical protein [Rhizobium sp. MC62]